MAFSPTAWPDRHLGGIRLRYLSSWTLIALGTCAGGWAAEDGKPAPTDPATPTTAPAPVKPAAAPPRKTPVGDHRADKTAPDGNELALFDDLPVVVSASRQKTQQSLAPAPVSVVTAEDIHYGGQTTVAEALLEVPGMDVLEINRNAYAIGVRGLHETFSDRTLTLINGRTAENPIYGGSEFQRMPLLMADIDRIEVVRGPGGAVWGANAFNGVINVITKDPEDVLGVFGTATVSAFGDVYSEVRWAEKYHDFAWRISFGYNERQSTADALSDNSLNKFDDSQAYVVDSEGVYHWSDDTTVRVGVGYSRLARGAAESLSYQPTQDDQLDSTRAFARWEHRVDKNVALKLQWTGNFYSSNEAAFEHDRSQEHEIEGQIDLDASHGHQVSVGGTARHTHIDAIPSSDPLAFQLPSPINETRLGEYVDDHWQATDDLVIESQGRLDNYSGTGNDWSGRISGLYSFDTDKNQVLRLSAAKAYRTPLVGLREASVDRVPVNVGPPFGTVYLFKLVTPTEPLQNEETWSVEAGYNGLIHEGLRWRLDTYYQHYQHLIGFVTTQVSNAPLPIPPTNVAQAANIAGAQGYGGEFELIWTHDFARLSAWYGYNGFETDQPSQAVRAFLPATHKVGATCRVSLSHGFTANLNYRYSSGASASGSAAADDAFNRIDLTVAWRFLQGRGELMAGVNDLLDDTPVVQGLASFTATEVPGRTFFLRGEWTL